MHLNRAAKSFVFAENRTDPALQSERSAPIEYDLIERAAEALFDFVFSGCDRLDGKRHWADCGEETKAGFRREASAVLEAIWPMLLSREIKSPVGQTSRVIRTFRMEHRRRAAS
jgi:hypothetical protein